jgi:hypothetical protein
MLGLRVKTIEAINLSFCKTASLTVLPSRDIDELMTHSLAPWRKILHHPWVAFFSAAYRSNLIYLNRFSSAAADRTSNAKTGSWNPNRWHSGSGRVKIVYGRYG